MGRPTLKEVAARAGVSYQTVSKVLNHQAQVSPETARRIQRAVRALGYRPDHRARSLRARRSWLIGYSWAPAPPDQANPILDQFLQSMLQAAERSGYHLLTFAHLTDMEDRISAYRELVTTGRVDGFVLSNVEYDDPRIAYLQQEQFPFVAFGRSNPDWDFPYVDVDGEAGLRAATEHMLALGHWRVMALAWPQSSRVGANRLVGYHSAMRAAGIDPPDGWIARGEGRFDFGLAATLRWLALPADERPTAIVALNDAMAIGALHAAAEAGLRPGVDLAVSGFDDAPMAQYLTPPLTTLRQPVWEIGQAVISILVTLLEGGDPQPRQVLIPPTLIVRGSTAAVPA